MIPAPFSTPQCQIKRPVKLFSPSHARAYHEVMAASIYLDHNATTPLLPEVADVMRDCWEKPYLNPSSQHELGRLARRLIDDAYVTISLVLGTGFRGDPRDRVIFTSGGTESNNLAIRGLLYGGRRFSDPARAQHIAISAIEHPSIAALADELQREGHHVDRIPVDANGVVRIDKLRDMLRPETAVVAVMLANNETGVIQPIGEIAALCNERNVPLHCDAAQAVGKLPVNFRELGAATMTVAAHKFHGPVGIGALIVRHDIELKPQLFGGFQQGGIRPGTESVVLAVGMRDALALWHKERDIRDSRMRNLRDRFEQTILSGYPDAVIIGAAAERLPNTSNIAFVGVDRQMLFMAIDQAGVACSTGSACASGSSEPSPVLLAMGLDEAVISSSLRFSLGATTTAADIDEAARRILHCCNNLRRAK
jgi:cysteine desulfurase